MTNFAGLRCMTIRDDQIAYLIISVFFSAAVQHVKGSGMHKQKLMFYISILAIAMAI